MKRFLLYLLSLMMLLGTLAACTPSNPQPPVGTDAESTAAPESQAPEQDVPKADAFVTTTDLVLPTYSYDPTDQNNNGILPATRDVFADTWVATDGADRSTPDAANTKDPSENVVGIFYFLWRDRDQSSISEIPASDHYAAYLEGGVDSLLGDADANTIFIITFLLSRSRLHRAVYPQVCRTEQTAPEQRA